MVFDLIQADVGRIIRSPIKFAYNLLHALLYKAPFENLVLLIMFGPVSLFEDSIRYDVHIGSVKIMIISKFQIKSLNTKR